MVFSIANEQKNLNADLIEIMKRNNFLIIFFMIFYSIMTNTDRDIQVRQLHTYCTVQIAAKTTYSVPKSLNSFKLFSQLL